MRVGVKIRRNMRKMKYRMSKITGLLTCIIPWMILWGIVMVYGSVKSLAIEIRDIPQEVQNEVLSRFPKGAYLDAMHALEVFTMLESTTTYYAIPVKKGNNYIGAFALRPDGSVQSYEQPIHLADFIKLETPEKVEKYTEEIGKKEKSIVKSWHYMYSKDLATSSIIYTLVNGNHGAYILTSEVIPEGKAFSISDFKVVLSKGSDFASSGKIEAKFVNTLFNGFHVMIVFIGIGTVFLGMLGIVRVFKKRQHSSTRK